MSCKKCKLSGHNSATCKATAQTTNEESSGRSLKEIGRAILEKEEQKVPREPDLVGTIPEKGLWLINPVRKRIAGKISQIKKNGDILWIDAYGCFIETPPETIKEGGYLYLDLEAPHLLFEVTNKTRWGDK